ncbi:MAG: DNA-processing protein DprA, partial [Chloroflexi bacterium]|nr:DNA-processing protein DprA [Chloroflexota bacterium]
MTAPEELKYWVALNRITGLGRVRHSLLENHFPSMEEAWNASASELKAAGLDGRLASRVVSERAAIDPEAELERLAKHNVTPLTWHDPAYPTRLKEIYDLPPVLYVRGQLTAADEWCVA